MCFCSFVLGGVIYICTQSEIIEIIKSTLKLNIFAYYCKNEYRDLPYHYLPTYTLTHQPNSPTNPPRLGRGFQTRSVVHLVQCTQGDIPYCTRRIYSFLVSLFYLCSTFQAACSPISEAPQTSPGLESIQKASSRGSEVHKKGS